MTFNKTAVYMTVMPVAVLTLRSLKPGKDLDYLVIFVYFPPFHLL